MPLPAFYSKLKGHCQTAYLPFLPSCPRLYLSLFSCCSAERTRFVVVWFVAGCCWGVDLNCLLLGACCCFSLPSATPHGTSYHAEPWAPFACCFPCLRDLTTAFLPLPSPLPHYPAPCSGCPSQAEEEKRTPFACDLPPPTACVCRFIHLV